MATFSYTTAPTWPIQGGAVVSTTVAGVLNTTSEVQTVTITATGGTFKLIYDGQVTSALAYNASTATVQAALWALSNIADNDVAVTGTAGNYTLTWINSLGNVNPVEVVTKSLTATATASERGWVHPVTGEVLVAIKDLDDKQTDITAAPTFTGVLSGGKGTAVVATTVPGVLNTTSEVQTITVTATGGTFTITYSGQTTAALAYNASTATVQAALWALSNIADNDVAVTGTAGNYTLTWINSLGNVAQPTTTVTNLVGNITFVTGDVMLVTVTASEAVTIDGIPKLVLTFDATERNAFFDAATSTSTSLKFKYTVVAEDVATAGQFSIGTDITLDTNISDNLAAGGYVPIDNSAKVIGAITTTSVTVN
jgi:hypothetical protein